MSPCSDVVELPLETFALRSSTVSYPLGHRQYLHFNNHFLVDVVIISWDSLSWPSATILCGLLERTESFIVPLKLLIDLLIIRCVCSILILYLLFRLCCLSANPFYDCILQKKQKKKTKKQKQLYGCMIACNPFSFIEKTKKAVLQKLET